MPDEQVDVLRGPVDVRDERIEPDDVGGQVRVGPVGTVRSVAAGSNGSAPGRKSRPRSRPALRTSRSWISGSGSASTEGGIELDQDDLRDRQAERPAELAGDELRDERLRALAGGMELDDVQTVVVRLEESGQGAALAQRGDVAGRGDGPQGDGRIRLASMTAESVAEPPSVRVTVARGAYDRGRGILEHPPCRRHGPDGCGQDGRRAGTRDPPRLDLRRQRRRARGGARRERPGDRRPSRDGASPRARGGSPPGGSSLAGRAGSSPRPRASSRIPAAWPRWRQPDVLVVLLRASVETLVKRFDVRRPSAAPRHRSRDDVPGAAGRPAGRPSNGSPTTPSTSTWPTRRNVSDGPPGRSPNASGPWTTR